MSIKRRLALLVGVLLAMLVLGAAGFLLQLRDSNAALQRFYNERVAPSRQLKTVADAFSVDVADSVRKVHQGTMSAVDGAAAIGSARTHSEAAWGSFTSRTLSERERALVEKAAPLLQRAESATTLLLGMLRANDIDGVRHFATHDLYAALDPVAEVLNELSLVQLEQLALAEAEYQASQRNYERVFRQTLFGAPLALAIAGLLAWALSRSITRPLAQAVTLAQTVAAGDLSRRIEATGASETQQLLAALQRMSEALGDIVGRVRSSSDSIAIGSAQIAAGNADLSQRTEAQASQLQRTAATMEELQATVRHNAEMARQVNALAADAAGAAAQGGRVVGEVIATMQEVESASRRAATIVGRIDEIASQTGILALNAAVEAARAGEQGRGFAVVAAEVRQLAQRAAAAARDVQVLIGDTVGQVATGSARAADAGRTMREIVAQFEGVSALVAQISEGNAAQERGIGEVGAAVEQLDQVAQHNAALVEESAAASEHLRHQASDLAQTVAWFKVG
jgi:methyl-accepting chemotaxis protein